MNLLLFAQTNLIEVAGKTNLLDVVENSVPESIKMDFMGVAVWRYVLALLVLLAGFTFKKILEIFVLRRLVQFSSRTKFKYDELLINAISQPISALVLIASVYAATLIVGEDLQLSDAIGLLINKAYLVGMGSVVIWAAYRLVDVFANYLDDVACAQDRSVRGQFIPVIRQSLRIFVLVIGSLTLLASIDVDIKALLGGLGIGGIAIALAAQDAVGNFIGTISIFTDRPFKVGDWIIVGDKVDGNVEQIGFRSTKVRTWPKTLMSIPNKVLATEIVDNWSRMPKRRVKMTVGVTYSTAADQMEELLRRIRQLLADDSGVDQDFFLVRFTDFGASSLDIFLYYFTKSIKWDEHLAVRERVNLNIIRTVHAMGLSIAFPTRSIHLESLPAGLQATSLNYPDSKA